jgi:hypothetical protein
VSTLAQDKFIELMAVLANMDPQEDARAMLDVIAVLRRVLESNDASDPELQRLIERTIRRYEAARA